MMATYEIGGIFNVLQSCKSKPANQEKNEEEHGKVNLSDLFTVAKQSNVVEEENSDCEASTDDDFDDEVESEDNNEENEENDDEDDDDMNDENNDRGDEEEEEDDILDESDPDENDDEVEMTEVDKSSEMKVKTSKKESAKKKDDLTQKDSNVLKTTAPKLEKVEKKEVLADTDDKDLKKMQKIKQEESPERLERTLFVGNVSINVTKKTLKKIFIEFGEIETLRFRSFIGADLKVPKKVAVIKKEFHAECKSLHAYVVYKNKESIGKALKCNGMVLEGLHLRVDTAVPQKKQTNQNSVFVGNLPFNIPDEDVYEHFKKCGTIDYVRIIRDKPTGVGKGFGYVAFTNRDGFIFGLKLNGTKLNGREIRVSRCENTNRFNSVRKGSGDGGGFLNKQNRKNNQQPQFQGLKASTSMKDRIKGRKFVQQKQKRTKPNNALRRIKNKSNTTSDSSIGSKKKSKSAGKQYQKKMKKKKM